MLQILVSFGFHVNEKCRPGSDCALPLCLACRAEHVDIVMFLIRDCGVDFVSGHGCLTQTPSLQAVSNGILEVVKYYIENAKSTTEIYTRANELLPSAVENKQSMICDFLLSQGAQVNRRHRIIRYARFECVLFCAVRTKSVATARILLNAGAYCNITNSHGDTPLFCAVQNGDLGMVQLLISRGADPSLRGRISPLHQALSMVQYDITRYLLLECNVPLEFTKRNGIDILMPLNNKDETPFTEALRNKRYDMLSLLVSAGYIPVEEREPFLALVRDIETDNLPKSVDPTDEIGYTEDTIRERLETLKCLLCTPRRLEMLCAVRIRNHLDRGLADVESLPLPEKLKTRIRLSHMRDRCNRDVVVPAGAASVNTREDDGDRRIM